MTYVAIDVHKSSSTFAFYTPASGERGKRRVSTNLGRFAEVLAPLPRPWIVAIEATRQSPAACAWLEKLQVDEIHLTDPQTVHAVGKLNIAKTDLKDAELMLDLLLRDYLPECYRAPEPVVERRALTRGHDTLRGIATQLRNLIRAALCHAGLEIQGKNLTGKAALQELGSLLEELPQCQALVAGEFLGLLTAVEKSIQKVDQRITQEVKADPVACELRKHAGIGDVTCLGMMAEIGQVERFPGDKKLHSYSGTAPKTFRTDEFAAASQHLPDRCNKRLRHWAVMAAQSAVRSRAPSGAKTTYERLLTRHRANTAKIAAAREILSYVYYVWKALGTAQPAADGSS